MLKTQLEFDEAQKSAWQILSCGRRNQDTLTQIQAAYYLTEIYRITYERDSLFLHHEEAQSLAKAALPIQDSLALKCEHRAGIVALLQDQYTVAKQHFDTVDSLYKKGSWRSFTFEIDQLQAYGNYYEEVKDFPQAYQYFSAGIAICKAQEQAIAEERLGSFYSNLSAVIEKQGDALTALEFNQRSLDLFFKYHNDTHPEALLVYNNLGGDYLTIGNYEKAKPYLEAAYEALRLAGRSERSPTDIVLNNLGYAYYECGDIDKAILSYQKAIAIRKETYGEDHLRTLRAQLHLASMYVERDEPEVSIRLLEASKKALQAKGESGAYLLAICQNNLAIAYRNTEAYDKALMNYEASLNLYQTRKNNTDRNQAQTYLNLTRTWISKGDYNQAIQCAEKAIQLFEAANGPEANETIYAKGTLGEPLYLNQEYVVAKTQYATAFAHWGITDPDSDLSDLEDKVSVLKLLASAIECYWAAYQDTKDTADLQQLLSYGQMAIRLLEHQRKRLGEEQTKTLLTDHYYQIYERIIQTQLLLTEQAQAIEEEALALANTARSITLQEAIRQSGATSFAGVPQELITRKKELRVNISFLEKKLQQASSDNADELNKQLFNLHREREQLEQQINEDYPAYVKLLRGRNLSPSELQKTLPTNTAIIQYFLGDEIIVAFLTHSDGHRTNWATLPSDFTSKVEQFLGLLATPPTQEDNSLGIFASSAKALYQVIFAQVAEHIPASIEHLLIIPDGVLTYLPFELLCEPQTQASTSFRQLPYLLSKYTFTYAPSASVWAQMRRKVNSGARAIVMAPEFRSAATTSAPLASNRVSQLGPLYFNQEEADNIGKTIGAAPFLGTTATLEAFMRNSSEARLLHLATHAEVEANAPRYSYLAFSGADQQPDSNSLFLADIYNLNLVADMVVLSACNTGLGKLRRGEGILSLARGFAYAGAKSIVPSLWAVNDQSTAEIMTTFYQHLETGASKAAALQSAKLDYLQSQTSERTAHPYYWGAFIVIGDSTPLSFNGSIPFFWWLIGGAVLLFLVIVWRRRR